MPFPSKNEVNTYNLAEYQSEIIRRQFTAWLSTDDDKLVNARRSERYSKETCCFCSKFNQSLKSTHALVIFLALDSKTLTSSQESLSVIYFILLPIQPENVLHLRYPLFNPQIILI